jgi:hypothetical protein
MRCGSDALRSVGGGYQGGSFGVGYRYPLQLTLQCLIKSACYQLASNHCPVASKACCYGSHSLRTNLYYPRERQRKCPCVRPDFGARLASSSEPVSGP